jgi:hypothetical protein
LSERVWLLWTRGGRRTHLVEETAEHAGAHPSGRRYAVERGQRVHGC